MDKLKANMAAAKMLGLDKEYETPPSGWGISLIELKDGKPNAWVRDFNLFTSDSDLVAGVKRLGDKHNVYIYPVHNRGWRAIGWDENPISDIFDTYEEAVGAACIATQEGV